MTPWVSVFPSSSSRTSVSSGSAWSCPYAPRRWPLAGFLCVFFVLVGCGRSDPIVLIAPHPTKSHILYVATNDYIYKSRDAGNTWENISRGMTYSRVIAMAIDPKYPATVYAGTKGDAVFKSYDGGQRWVPRRNGLDDVTITSVVNQFVFDPNDNRRIFVATTMGVFETRDGGDSWTKRMDGMKEVMMVVTLAMDPTNPEVMYAGTNGGVYKSLDQAGNWFKANKGLIPQDLIKSSRALDVTVMVVAPDDLNTVYAATLKGLFKSTNAGNSWSRVGQSLPDQMLSGLVLDRTNPNILYVASRQGVHRSVDGGNTWEPKNQGLMSLNIRSLIQSPINPSLWYAGTNGSGLYQSSNGGENWEPLPLKKVRSEK